MAKQESKIITANGTEILESEYRDIEKTGAAKMAMKIFAGIGVVAVGLTARALWKNAGTITVTTTPPPVV